MAHQSIALPYKDFTIKARLDYSKETERGLQELNAMFIGTDVQVDHYFEIPKGKLKWREGVIENLITHYERFQDSGIERTLVYRYDLDPTQDQISELQRNHKLIGITKKERKIYKINNIKIHLDKLPNEEEFIEIEAIDRDGKFTIDELRSQCLEIKTKLKIADKNLVLTGYLKNGESKI